MADLPSDFWGGWIALITVTSLIGLGWLLYGVYFADGGESPAESTVWDENLREGSTPAPMWWFWLILALMVFSVIYLMLYPGLGTYRGALQWSQGGRLAESYALYGIEFDERRAEVAAAALEDLHADEAAMASARRVFTQNCAVCHGPEGGGQAATFPNLMDDDWQWGGEALQIEQTLRNGRQAVMPPLGVALGEDGVAQLVDYVVALASGEPADGLPGRTLFTTYCSACHGAEGTGNPILGGPNLTDQIWLYGGSEAAIAETINSGRNGVMPPFGERLDAAQLRLLLAWLTR
jgi:cytochrome c oxidase cbb3-type subunit 3